jgi:hypothetical protein
VHDDRSVSDVQGDTAPVHAGASQTQPLSDAHSLAVAFALHGVNVPVQTTGHEQYSVSWHDPSVVKPAHGDGVPLHPLGPHVQPAAVHTDSPYPSPRTTHDGSVPTQGPPSCVQPGQYELGCPQNSVGQSAHAVKSGLPLHPARVPATQSGHTSALHANCSSHSGQVEADTVPTHSPTLGSVEHPGQMQASWSSKHVAHVVSSAAPAHMGVTAKSTGGGGRATVGDLQQISPKQSLSCVHVMAHVAEQRPLQQMLPPDVCSHWADDEQTLGHAWMAGFRQRPDTLRFGSTACTVVQQISPSSVLHSESRVHAVGHCRASVQMGRS